MKQLAVLVLAVCGASHAQTNFTFGPGPPNGNVPPPYLSAGTWVVSGVTPVPYTPITTDGWGNLSSVGALSSYGAIGGQGLTISGGTQSAIVLAVQNNISTGTATNELACWDPWAMQSSAQPPP